MAKKVFLSKSKLMSARQCPKRLYLEVHRKDLVVYSASTEAAFRKGNTVGDIAHAIYGTDKSVFIPFEGTFSHKISKTRRLLSADDRAPIFEGTLQYEGVTVRADVLLPDGDGWRLVEVKASTTVKPEHSFDCAVQAWVFSRSGFSLNSVSLAHVDNTFEYEGNGDYRGLLTEENMDDDVDALFPSVAEWVSEGRAIVSGDEPEVAVGARCYAPYECPFIDYCWPRDTAYPVDGLGGGIRKDALGRFVASGHRDVRDIPADALNDTQRRIQRITVSGEPELLPSASEFVSTLGYPRYYVDFETINPPVPLWAETTPYRQLPFQWSCHMQSSNGELQHSEFLDLTGDAPMRRFAESLIRVVGKSGPIIVYSAFEKTRLNEAIVRFPDLESALTGIIGRLVDILPISRESYYHPDMHGSWSIKAVLPTIAPDLDYGALEGVQDGNAASEAYAEAISSDTPSDRKEELRSQLLEYCRYDTLAMVRLVEFLGGQGAPG